MSRTIQSNFFDAVKQEAIELLLMGDFFSEEYADKGKMLMDHTALLGKTNTDLSFVSDFSCQIQAISPLREK